MQMKKVLVIALLFTLGLFSPVLAQAKSDSKMLKLFEDLQQVIISVSNSVKAAVVHIEVVHKQDDLKFKSLASGLIVDEKGYILTNEHVVDKATSVMVTLDNKL